MKCPVCQAGLPEGAKFCPQCGAKVEEEGSNPALLALASQYEQRLKENPKDTATRFNLALTYLKLKRWGAAVQQLELICQQEPDFPDAWYLLALACKNIGQKERAKALIADFIRRFPYHPKALELRQRRTEPVDNPALTPTKLLSQKEAKGKDEGAGENEKGSGI